MRWLIALGIIGSLLAVGGCTKTIKEASTTHASPASST